MKFAERRKTNHFAIVGFLAPFLSAGLLCLLLLVAGETLLSSPLLSVYLVGVPLILLVGAVFSIKSIPRIEEMGEKDYAYAGLVLNLFFLFVYAISLFYFFFNPNMAA